MAEVGRFFESRRWEAIEERGSALRFKSCLFGKRWLGPFASLGLRARRGDLQTAGIGK
jgi:hypothetical protein